jgi:hypothetical protein
MWRDEIHHTPGPGGSALLGGLMDSYNAVQSNSNRDKYLADQMRQRYIDSYKNPMAMEGFEGTDEGSDAMSKLGLSPDMVNSSVQSSPQYKEREFLKGYDPEDDESGMGLYKGMLESGDTATAKSLAPGIRQSKKDAAMAQRQEDRGYNTSADRVSQDVQKSFIQMVKNGLTPEQAIKAAIAYNPGFARLHPEDQESIKAQVNSFVDPSTGQVLPGVSSLISQREAKADELDSQADLNRAKIPLTQAQISYLNSRASLSGAVAALRKAQEGEIDEKGQRDLLKAAERARADVSKFGKNDARAKQLTDLADKLEKMAAQGDDESEVEPDEGASTPEPATPAQPQAKPASSPSASPVTKGPAPTKTKVYVRYGTNEKGQRVGQTADGQVEVIQ